MEARSLVASDYRDSSALRVIRVKWLSLGIDRNHLHLQEFLLAQLKVLTNWPLVNKVRT